MKAVHEIMKLINCPKGLHLLIVCISAKYRDVSFYNISNAMVHPCLICPPALIPRCNMFNSNVVNYSSCQC